MIRDRLRIGTSRRTARGLVSVGQSRSDRCSGDRRLARSREADEDGFARGENVERSPAGRRLLHKQRRRRLGEQRPLQLAPIAAEHKKQRRVGQGNLLAAEFVAGRGPGCRNVGPAAALVFQPQSGCLVDQQRHQHEQQHERERLSRTPPRLEHGAVSRPQHHARRQRDDDELEQGDDPGDPRRDRCPAKPTHRRGGGRKRKQQDGEQRLHGL